MQGNSHDASKYSFGMYGIPTASATIDISDNQPYFAYKNIEALDSINCNPSYGGSLVINNATFGENCVHQSNKQDIFNTGNMTWGGTAGNGNQSEQAYQDWQTFIYPFNKLNFELKKNVDADKNLKRAEEIVVASLANTLKEGFTDSSDNQNYYDIGAPLAPSNSEYSEYSGKMVNPYGNSQSKFSPVLPEYDPAFGCRKTATVDFRCGNIHSAKKSQEKPGENIDLSCERTNTLCDSFKLIIGETGILKIVNNAKGGGIRKNQAKDMNLLKIGRATGSNIYTRLDRCNFNRYKEFKKLINIIDIILQIFL